MYLQTNENVISEKDVKEVLQKLKPLYYFAWMFDNLSPGVQNFSTGGSSVFQIPPPPLFSPGGWSCVDSGAIQYLHVSLFGFHRKGRLAFMCMICHSSDSVPAFKALGAVWTKPSVWVGRFIKWQTGSFYLANVSHGRWRRLVRLCEWQRHKIGRKREVERFQESLWKHFNIPQKRLNHRDSCNCTTERFLPLWICNNWIMEPFSFHLIPWNKD